MKIGIYNWDIFKKHFPKATFKKKILEDILLKHFKEQLSSPFEISIVFVPEKEIAELNEEYRQIDTPTDVLSFLIEKEPLNGEIYISPEYICKEYSEKEVLRVIIHGFLHLIGMEHKGYFNEIKKKEEIFVIQENMLENILYEVNSRTG